MNRFRAYFRDLVSHTTQGWNRFWFTPADPATICLIRILAGAMLCYTHAVWTLDLAAFFFLAKFTEKPLRFFGLVGSLFFAAGTVTSLVLLVNRLEGQPIANRPLLLLTVLCLALGVQLMGLGLVGEIIVHLRAPHRRAYRVRERV